MKIILPFVSLFILLNTTSYSQITNVKIRVEGVGTFNTNDIVTVQPNRKYTLTAMPANGCVGTPVYRWGNSAEQTGIQTSSVQVLSGQTAISVNYESVYTPGSCGYTGTCRIYLQPPSTSIVEKPKPDFYMNGSNASSITVNRNATVSFTDKSTNNPTSWRYAIMVTINGDSKRVFYTDPPKTQNPTYTFVNKGRHRIYFWAANAKGTSPTISKEVVVQ